MFLIYQPNSKPTQQWLLAFRVEGEHRGLQLKAKAFHGLIISPTYNLIHHIHFFVKKLSHLLKKILLFNVSANFSSLLPWITIRWSNLKISTWFLPCPLLLIQIRQFQPHPSCQIFFNFFVLSFIWCLLLFRESCVFVVVAIFFSCKFPTPTIEGWFSNYPYCQKLNMSVMGRRWNILEKEEKERKMDHDHVAFEESIYAYSWKLELLFLMSIVNFVIILLNSLRVPLPTMYPSIFWNK